MLPNKKKTFIFFVSMVSMSLLFAGSDYVAAGALSKWLGELCNDTWFTDDQPRHTHMATGVIFGASTTVLGWGARWSLWKARTPKYVEF
jgi:hypothetical protein